MGFFARIARPYLAPGTGFALAALLAFAPLLAGQAQAEPPVQVYRWNATDWLTKYNSGQFTASPFTNPDGTIGAKVAVSPRDALNPYNHIVVTAAAMKSGHSYTAILTCRVETPTQYPTSFYLFARNSAGNQYDIWQTWIGLPGPTRTIALPMNLKTIPGGTWKLYMGISKSGALLINSLVVYEGLTSDGKTCYLRELPTAGAGAKSPLPTGVTEATGYTPFSVAPPGASGGTITLAAPTYAFVAERAGAPASVAVANQAALQQALKDCQSQHASKLVIPPGTYDLSSISSTKIDGLSDLTIDGQGAILRIEKMTKDGVAIQIVNCARLQLENLGLDWDWKVIPIASLGVVSNLSPDKLQCDFTFPDLDATATELTRTTPWRAIFSMEPTHLVIDDPSHFSVPKGTVIVAGSAPNVLHATFPTAVSFQKGKSYCIRHLYYDMGGFKIGDNQDLTFKNVSIYSIPGMGWFCAGEVHDLQLLGCKILRLPGSRHPLTTAADGIHVDQSAGNTIIQDCSITGTGDDEMNIHNEVYEAEIQTDPQYPTRLTLLHCPSYQLRLKPNDPVEFFNADFSDLSPSVTPVSDLVSSTTSNNKIPETVIEFDQPLPAGITPQTILRNARFGTHNVLISRCTDEYSNGRGLLLSATNATVTGCHFRHLGGTAIDLEAEIVQPLWTQGRGASNVLIKDNTFENIDPLGRYGSAIIYTNARIPWGPSETKLFKQITIEDNKFLNCPGPALSLSNASAVVFRANEIRFAAASPNPNANAGGVNAIRSSDLALGGNTWINEIPNPAPPAIIYDPASTTNVEIGSNSLIDPR